MGASLVSFDPAEAGILKNKTQIVAFVGRAVKH